MRARFLDFLVRSVEGAVAGRDFSSGVASEVGASEVDDSSILVSSSVDARDCDLVLIRVDRSVSVLLALEP